MRAGCETLEGDVQSLSFVCVVGEFCQKVSPQGTKSWVLAWAAWGRRQVLDRRHIEARTIHAVGTTLVETSAQPLHQVYNHQ